MVRNSLLKKGNKTLSIEAEEGFDFYLYDEARDRGQAIYNASAKEALEVAAGIIHAVWTLHPDAANRLVNAMQLGKHADRIPDVWDEITRQRNEQD